MPCAGSDEFRYSMKVFDLQCEHEHRFEGWFGSAAAYDTQREQGLVQCPMCGSPVVQRLPSAPHLNVSSLRDPGAMQARAAVTQPHGSGRHAAVDGDARAAAEQGAGTVAGRRASGQRIDDSTPEARMADALQAAWLKMAREVIRQTENVGAAFADEARKIHYQEAPARAIRGHATAEQVAELADEGIDVLPLPIPDSAKETLQ